MEAFRNKEFKEIPVFDFSACMSPHMHQIVADMRGAHYTGYLKRLYLEAKSVELFLLQIHQLDTGTKQTKLTKEDQERLHFLKSYIQEHLDHHFTLIGLARMVGINQQKLKTGFKSYSVVPFSVLLQNSGCGRRNVY